MDTELYSGFKQAAMLYIPEWTQKSRGVKQAAKAHLHATARFMALSKMMEVVPDSAPVATCSRGRSTWKNMHRE